MFGSLLGDLAGAAYFLYFQAAGVLLMLALLKNENILMRLLLGSVAGSLMLQWLPIPFSFLLGFSLASHALGAAAALPAFYVFIKRRAAVLADMRALPGQFKQHEAFFGLLAAFMLLWCYLLSTHIIPLGADGAVYTGQCTYGDMNMHLGFITSIANQSAFPADYSIFPGVKLAYPFLSDSISSSVYLFGASLRFAYILPMIFAMAQIFCEVYALALAVLGAKNKAIAVFLLFFLNGGLGFCYFVDWSSEAEYTLGDIFTGFYTTPTNLVGHNIRWVNVLADMFLPQRATLFGYAVLFACLWLLYSAVFGGKAGYFVPAAVFGGALPMIHTHSFLALALVSASWMLVWLYERTHKAKTKAPESYAVSKWLLVGFVGGMCFLQYLDKNGAVSSGQLMALGVGGIAVLTAYGVYLLAKCIKAEGWSELWRTWGVYLVIVLALALPQLCYWTFGQVQEGGFVRGYFGWGNLGDFYPWFYLKNLSLPLVLLIGAVWSGRKKHFPLIAAAMVIWFLAELIVFTPNTYDNNKLLYVAYLLLLVPGVDWAAGALKALRGVGGARALAGVFAFLCVFSGVLTLGREAVSKYQLYGTAYVELAGYVDENTPTDAVFLTGTRHNNEIASLTGRSIVCGSSSFLYYHGIDTTEREGDIKAMYETPAASAALFEKYGVDYIELTDYERSTYTVDESYFEQNCTLVFSSGSALLYKVNN